MGLSDFFKKGVEKPAPQPKAPEVKTESKPVAPVNEPAAETYTVKKGDSLSLIAKHFYGDAKSWNKIFEANKSQIKDPDKIFPGMVLTIPKNNTPMNNKHMTIKSGIFYMLLCLLIVGYGCQKKETDPKKIFSGDSSKKWKADKETNAAGEKEKLSGEEKKEVMEFSNTGSFTIDGKDGNANGEWTYDDALKNLSLKFKDAAVTENFSVLKLEDDEILLKGADGSTMELEAE